MKSLRDRRDKCYLCGNGPAVSCRRCQLPVADGAHSETESGDGSEASSGQASTVVDPIERHFSNLFVEDDTDPDSYPDSDPRPNNDLTEKAPNA